MINVPEVAEFNREPAKAVEGISARKDVHSGGNRVASEFGSLDLQNANRGEGVVTLQYRQFRMLAVNIPSAPRISTAYPAYSLVFVL